MVTLLNLKNIMDFPKKRTTFTKEQDPMSHRIIEKRRRDRMNNCLADLSRLIPPDYLKKGRGRIEKTEIIEMAIRHLKYLQERANCTEQRESAPISNEHFRLGYQECLSEVMRYLVEGQGHFPNDVLCVQLINHLQMHCEEIIKGDHLNKSRGNTETNSSSSGSCSNYAIHMQQLNKMAENRAKALQSEDNTNSESSRLQNHSNKYSSYPEETTYQQNNEMENSRLHSEQMDESPDDSTNEQTNNTIFHQSNSQLPVITNGNMVGLNLTESNVDEGGGVNQENEFLEKNLLENENTNDVEADNQPPQDLRMNTAFSPMSPSYHHKMHNESNLRNIRKSSEMAQDANSNNNNADLDNIHSYKFKNNIKQRFSQSQSVDYRSSSPSDGTNNTSSLSPDENVSSNHEMFQINGKSTHKRRKPTAEFRDHCRNDYDDYVHFAKNKPSPYETTSSDNAPSVSDTSAYHTNTPPDTDIKDMSFDKDKDRTKLVQSKFYNTNRYYKMCEIQKNLDDQRCNENLTGIGVPIFALHAKGSFYVPINIDYETLVPFLGPNDLLELTPMQQNVALHPVTINVNFQSNFSNAKFSAVRPKTERKNWQ